MIRNEQAAKEQAEARLVPDGDYVFKVQKSKFGPTNSGKYEMYSLNLNLFDETGKKRVYSAYLGSWDFKKIEDFLESSSPELYTAFMNKEAVEAHELVGLTGKLHIKQKLNKKTDKKTGKKTEEIEANIQYFVPLRDGETAPVVPELVEAEPEVAEDDVPF